MESSGGGAYDSGEGTSWGCRRAPPGTEGHRLVIAPRRTNLAPTLLLRLDPSAVATKQASAPPRFLTHQVAPALVLCLKKATTHEATRNPSSSSTQLGLQCLQHWPLQTLLSPLPERLDSSGIHAAHAGLERSEISVLPQISRMERTLKVVFQCPKKKLSLRL